MAYIYVRKKTKHWPSFSRKASLSFSRRIFEIPVILSPILNGGHAPLSIIQPPCLEYI